MDFFTLAKNRYSVRKFSERSVEPEKLEKVLKPRVWHRQPIIISLFAFMCLKARMPLPRSVN